MSNRLKQKAVNYNINGLLNINYCFYNLFFAGFIFIMGCNPQNETHHKIDLNGFDLVNGEQVYNNLCMACHTPGMFGAPKMGDKSLWNTRIAQGMTLLVHHSINGINAMPPKGGDLSLSDKEIKNAVAFMVSKSQ